MTILHRGGKGSYIQEGKNGDQKLEDSPVVYALSLHILNKLFDLS